MKTKRDPALTSIRDYAFAFLGVAAATGFLLIIRDHLDKAHTGLIYILVVATLAATGGTRPAVLGAILSFLAWNYFFLPPRFTFILYDPQDWILLFTFLVIGVLIGHITGRMRAVFVERERLLEETARLSAAQESERLKSVLFSSLSHNLKTPLASLSASLSNLRQSSGSPDQGELRECLDAIQQDVGRLAEYIHNLLSFAQLESGSWQPRQEWVELQEIVTIATERLPDRDYQRLQISIPNEFPLIQADSVQVSQAVRHLVENALKYSPSCASVTIRAETRDGVIELCVDDEGVGIPESERQVILQRFHGGANGSRGTGLGLAICREIVRGHHGTIAVESSPTGGARFRVVLPIKQN